MATIPHVPNLKDPILAVIDRHREAWSVFQVAPEGDASEAASLETHDALKALLGASCATRLGSIALLQHLRWWLAQEAVNAPAYGEQWGAAQARAADLTLFLGMPPVPAVQAEPFRHDFLSLSTGRNQASRYDGSAFDAWPSETQPGAIEPWQAVAPIRPGTPYSRSLRLLDGMGEIIACLCLICGGTVVIGIATLT